MVNVARNSPIPYYPHSIKENILWKLRFPCVLAVLIVGAALRISRILFREILLN